MNQFLSSRYVEVIQRLALGIEPIDAQSARRLSYALQVVYDVAPFGLRRPPIERHASNLYALRYQPGVTEQIDVRFFDLSERAYKPEYDRRRVVPRRLSIPIFTLDEVEEQELQEAEAAGKQAKDFRRRIRRPVFFPGAAYDFIATATGLRGRVMRGGKPMRWARVVATLGTTVVGRAHGDDRGEFLLLVNAKVATVTAVPKPLEITVSVFAPKDAPTPVPANLPELDPLWDLPLEKLAEPGEIDPVAAGEQPPWEETKSVTRVVTFIPGECLSGEEDFVITT